MLVIIEASTVGGFHPVRGPFEAAGGPHRASRGGQSGLVPVLVCQALFSPFEA